VRKTKACVS